MQIQNSWGGRVKVGVLLITDKVVKKGIIKMLTKYLKGIEQYLESVSPRTAAKKAWYTLQPFYEHQTNLLTVKAIPTIRNNAFVSCHLLRKYQSRLKAVSPTSDATKFHNVGVFLQIHKWKGEHILGMGTKRQYILPSRN